MDTDFSKIQAKIPVYLQIMNLLQKTDVSQNREFQRLCNGYYRIRQRPATFYQVFYQFLEENKNNQDLTYCDVLEMFYYKTGRVERSFGSKLLATVRPEFPIWDQFVLKNIGQSVPPYGTKDLPRILSAYEDICVWYQTDEAKSRIAIFDMHFPNVKITNTKKIDFILWQTR